jgi:hypothetical protein
MKRDSLWRVIGGIERRLGQSIEGLFPLKGSVQPVDVIEAVERAMADPRNRSPWRDGKVYAPNRYTVHVVCTEEAQRDFLFTFLTDAELARVLQEHAQKEGYRFLSRPQFELQVHEEPVPGKGDRTLWVEHGWASPEAEADEHEQPTLPPLRGVLVVLKGPDEGTEIELREPTVQIGRSRRMGNTVVLSDRHVSRKHARIEFGADGAITIENLRGDENPMAVNGRAAARSVLQFGDKVKLGETLFAVNAAESKGDEVGGGDPAEQESSGCGEDEAQ